MMTDDNEGQTSVKVVEESRVGEDERKSDHNAAITTTPEWTLQISLSAPHEK
jgi:hypothetical protein